MDIIVSYCEDWYTPLKTSKYHLIKGLAKEGNKILYVETPVSLFQLFKNPRNFIKVFAKKKFFRPVNVYKNVWSLSSISLVPFFKGFGPVFDSYFMNKVQQLFLYPFIKYSLRKLKFSNLYMITYLPLILPLISKLKPKRHLYHIVDEWNGLENLPKTVSHLILKNFKYSDITVVSSQPLYDRYSALSKDIKLLRHGTNIQMFNKVFIPGVEVADELKIITGKKVGYYGALHKLDFNLIKKVAERLNNIDFFFIGPITGAQGLKREISLPSNCFIWDSWERKRLPNFLAGLDVFWMPFLDNELTQFMSPIKIFEVMSAGLPIVSTNLKETRLAGGELNSYANNFEEHVSFIDIYLNSDSDEDSKERLEYTKDLDWSVRQKVFSGYLLNK